ncbi:hypothetical protein [Fischerella sp. PCC 9605]|uniref:hypothetical protein n=1 Tax=Fischerella sp. PCC 9605 TaxID=1173024 RepID=UPI00047BFE58|nr:hypothetical protein [Fischerella sp. PCC 9605]
MGQIEKVVLQKLQKNRDSGIRDSWLSYRTSVQFQDVTAASQLIVNNKSDWRSDRFYFLRYLPITNVSISA